MEHEKDSADGLIPQALRILAQYVNDVHGGNKQAAMKALGMKAQTGLLGKWLRGERVPSLTSLSPILERLGCSLAAPAPGSEISRDVCFVDARVVPSGEGQPVPENEDYLAVPLVDEVGAGPGIIPRGSLKSWFLVYRNTPSIMYRRDLIAVQIGAHSTSMEPVLHPGDIVLVDRSDRDANRPGRIMLVMEPDEGAAKVKRVSLEKLRDDWRIIFYSDNAVENPPEIYSLREDYGGDISRVIVGRVVWAWSDISRR